jgi:DNA-directed RNA polymerase specialized sigma24 family protein
VAAQKKDPQPLGQDKALSALVGLMAAEREDRFEPSPNGSRRTEVVLSDAGLTNLEIAGVMGKTKDAVQKVIQRARKPPRRKKA